MSCGSGVKKDRNPSLVFSRRSCGVGTRALDNQLERGSAISRGSPIWQTRPTSMTRRGFALADQERCERNRFHCTTYPRMIKVFAGIRNTLIGRS